MKVFTRITTVLGMMVLLFGFAFCSYAADYVSPSVITIEQVKEGQQIHKHVILGRHNPKEEVTMQAQIELGEEFLTIQAQEFVLPVGESKYEYDIDIDTTGLENGQYVGLVNFKPQVDEAEKTGFAIVKSFSVGVKFTVVDEVIQKVIERAPKVDLKESLELSHKNTLFERYELGKTVPVEFVVKNISDKDYENVLLTTEVYQDGVLQEKISEKILFLKKGESYEHIYEHKNKNVGLYDIRSYIEHESSRGEIVRLRFESVSSVIYYIIGIFIFFLGLFFVILIMYRGKYKLLFLLGIIILFLITLISYSNIFKRNIPFATYVNDNDTLLQWWDSSFDGFMITYNKHNENVETTYVTILRTNEVFEYDGEWFANTDQQGRLYLYNTDGEIKKMSRYGEHEVIRQDVNGMIKKVIESKNNNYTLVQVFNEYLQEPLFFLYETKDQGGAYLNVQNIIPHKDIIIQDVLWAEDQEQELYIQGYIGGTGEEVLYSFNPWNDKAVLLKDVDIDFNTHENVEDLYAGRDDITRINGVFIFPIENNQYVTKKYYQFDEYDNIIGIKKLYKNIYSLKTVDKQFLFNAQSGQQLQLNSGYVFNSEDTVFYLSSSSSLGASITNPLIRLR